MNGRRLVATAFLLAVPATAGATDVVFDFSAPTADQVGIYSASAGAVVANGVGTLNLRGTPTWLDPTEQARVSVTIHNPGAAVLDTPIRIPLDSAGTAFLQYARTDGGDLRVGDALGSPVNAWLEAADTPSLHAAIWVRMPRLASGDTVLYVYAGSGAGIAMENGIPFFTFTAPLAWLVAGNTNTAMLALEGVSLASGDMFTAGTMAMGMLSQTSPATVAAGMLAPSDTIATNAPSTFLFGPGAGDAPIPLAFASTDFVEPTGRCVDAFTIVAPFADSDVTISDGASMVATQHVARGTSATVTADVVDMHAVVIHATSPVVVQHNAANCDVVDYAPLSVDLFGANGGTGLVAAATAANVTAYYSDGTMAALTVPAGTARALGCNGTEGSGCAVHLVSNEPIGALSYADGDGGDAEVFLDRSALGREFAIPRDAQYLHVATSAPYTTCRLDAPDGTVASTQMSGSLAPPYPNNLLFGASDNMVHVMAGSSLHCDQPVWVVLEDAGDEMEKNLWPVQLHRPLNLPALTFTIGMPQTRYGTSDEWVATPAYIPPAAAVTWLGFDDTNITLPANTRVGYQLSTDQGATWQYVPGGHWTAAPSATIQYTSTGGDIDNAIATLPTGPLAVRAVLESLDGVQAPVIDSLRVGIELAGTLAGIRLDPIASPQHASTTFAIHAVAIDSTGLTDATVNAAPLIESDAGAVTALGSPRFMNGVLDAQIRIQGTSPAAHVVVSVGGLNGVSNPFALVPAQAATLQLVSGDGQFATVGTMLPSPIVVRAAAASGGPVPGAVVTFAIGSGGGSLGQTSTLTDDNGYAATYWTLGSMPGMNTATASSAGIATSVTFNARGDLPGAVADTGSDASVGDGGGGGSGHGCGCRIERASKRDGIAGWLACSALVAIRLRRRRSTRPERARVAA